MRLSGGISSAPTLLLSLLFVGALAALSCSGNGKAAKANRPLLVEAGRALQSGANSDAERMFKEIASNSPECSEDYVEAMIGLVRTRVASGDRDGAKGAYRRVLVTCRVELDRCFGLARALRDQGDNEAAGLILHETCDFQSVDLRLAFATEFDGIGEHEAAGLVLRDAMRYIESVSDTDKQRAGQLARRLEDLVEKHGLMQEVEVPSMHSSAK